MKYIYSGATIKGQTHHVSALPNQDSFLIKKYSFGIVTVVADGLGSKKHSDIGSKSVCRAVSKAARIWSNYKDAPIEQLIRIIHNLWDLEILPYEKNDCGTTCLFCIFLFRGDIVFGQLGDGVIAYSMDQHFKILSNKNDAFLNFTQSIHSVQTLDHWTYHIEKFKGTDFSLLMATDGVSEDLIEEKRHAFMNYMIEQISEEETLTNRNRIVKKTLQNWITPYSYDDKTLILLNVLGGEDEFL
jgi:serine/threonine protein phosphatase PrpC